ncbi:MAG: ABC transporter permease [Planctomycetota bacterium]
MSERADAPDRSTPAAGGFAPARWAYLACRLFVGPIFQREVQAIGRRRAPYLVRGLYALALLGLTTLIFLATWDGAGGSAASRQDQLEDIAPAMLAAVAIGQMAMLAFIAPVLTAGAIADEKRTRTLATLLTTPLGSGGLVVGKLGARTVQLVILVLLPTPMLLALRVFGGIEAEAVLASTALALSLGILAASVSLLFSIWNTRTPTVVFFALCSTVLIVAGPIGWHMLINLTGLDPRWLPELRAVTPLTQMLLVIPELAQDLGYTSVAQLRDRWLLGIAYNLAWSLALVLLAIYILRGTLRREMGEEAGWSMRRRTREQPDDAKRRQRSRPRAAPSRDRDARTIGDRPVLWRELRQSALGGPNQTFAAGAIGVSILLIVYVTAGISHTGITPTALIILLLTVTAQTALSAPAGLAAERDGSNWDVLLATPVTPSQIVLGKALGAIRRMWLLPAVVGMHLVLVMATGWFHPIGALHALLVVGGAIVMLSGTGAMLGLLCRRGTTASVLNLGLPLVLWVALPICVGLCVQLIGMDYDTTQALGGVIQISNPFYVLAEAAMTGVAENDAYRYFLRYDLAWSERDVRPLEFTAFALANAAIMASLGVAATLVAIWRFNRWAGRSS